MPSARPLEHPVSSPPRTLRLSLVSHTNVGKTTLARTLLGRDVGEVRDAAHVTQTADGHLLLSTEAGDQLELWDTPGFGDSVRLARRLAQTGNPVGWFLTEVWDRFRDRAFFSSQKAIRHVLEQADVVLYLVNAAQVPEDARHVHAELQVVRLLNKPVVVLLNQLGQPAPPSAEAEQLARWRSALQGSSTSTVQTVLPLDAFSRCWVQEAVWLDAVANALPPDAHDAMARLRHAWELDRLNTFEAAMDLLAERLVAAAMDRQPVSTEAWAQRLKALGSAARAAVTRKDNPVAGAEASAMAALAERLARHSQQDTDQLIALHHLDGRAAKILQERVAVHFAVRQPVDEGKAALMGGVVAGALTGLKADIATGGLTLGGGMLAGGLLGALGAAGAAHGVNRWRGQDKALVSWRDDSLRDLLVQALISYLAVAHYGRGRGAWSEGENPAFWLEEVQAIIARHEAIWLQWLSRRPAEHAEAADEATALILRQSARPLLRALGRDLLLQLYPTVRWPSPPSSEA